MLSHTIRFSCMFNDYNVRTVGATPGVRQRQAALGFGEAKHRQEDGCRQATVPAHLWRKSF